MGLFNPYAPLLSDVNLLFQLAILCVIALGIVFRFKRLRLKHGTTMGTALVLHTFSIFAIMVPSLAGSVGLFRNPFVPLALAILLHAVLGSLVEVLGIYLVVVWALGHWNAKVCFRNKRVMDVTLISWLMELTLGIYVYILYYL
jgi:uncharacterized membrane protein YozB (DUF420 family)